MPYQVYIDESGDSGVNRIRSDSNPGASPYFVLAAVVVEPAGAVRAKRVVEQVRTRIGKKSWKHATELDHPATVFFCRQVAKLPIRCFATISNKATLGSYKDIIGGKPDYFYNKCLKYLLEIVCSYLSPHIGSPDDLLVILEQRNHDYDALIRYLQKVKETPNHIKAQALSTLNPFGITTRRKGEDPILEVADLVAHAVFQCTNKSKANYMIPEDRYFRELESRFAGDDMGKVLDTGLKCIHTLKQLELDPGIEGLFNQARAKPASLRPRNMPSSD